MLSHTEAITEIDYNIPLLVLIPHSLSLSLSVSLSLSLSCLCVYPSVCSCPEGSEHQIWSTERIISEKAKFLSAQYYFTLCMPPASLVFKDPEVSDMNTLVNS